MPKWSHYWRIRWLELVDTKAARRQIENESKSRRFDRKKKLPWNHSKSLKTESSRRFIASATPRASAGCEMDCYRVSEHFIASSGRPSRVIYRRLLVSFTAAMTIPTFRVFPHDFRCVSPRSVPSHRLTFFLQVSGHANSSAAFIQWLLFIKSSTRSEMYRKGKQGGRNVVEFWPFFFLLHSRLNLYISLSFLFPSFGFSFLSLSLSLSLVFKLVGTAVELSSRPAGLVRPASVRPGERWAAQRGTGLEILFFFRVSPSTPFVGYNERPILFGSWCVYRLRQPPPTLSGFLLSFFLCRYIFFFVLDASLTLRLQRSSRRRGNRPSSVPDVSIAFDNPLNPMVVPFQFFTEFNWVFTGFTRASVIAIELSRKKSSSLRRLSKKTNEWYRLVRPSVTGLSSFLWAPSVAFIEWQWVGLG